MTQGQTPAGWYPDPQTGDLLYWDGSQWTGHRQPAPTTGPSAPTAPYAPSYTPYPMAPGGQPGAQAPGNTLSIIGTVLGVVALVILPPVFGIAGIVLGVIALRKHERLGGVALGVSIVGLVAGMIIGALVFSSGM